MNAVVIKHLTRGTAALSLAVVALASPASASPVTYAAPAVSLQMPEPPAALAVMDELQMLTVEAPHSMAGYSREKFPHWAKQFGTCDTREVVLARDGEGVEQDAECRATSGTWTSLYDNKTFTVAGQLDIDHMVPLANSWRSGADTWTTAKRKQFANDLEHSQLIAVSAASNRSKGDQSPETWVPTNNLYWCTYSRAWTHIKSIYGLSVTEGEKFALEGMLNTCKS
ncbi:HNH endonuclease family protein [Streptomyces sp. ZAF1911]|uniref:HNH endonuclease family protein n=1 Tax=Streptomyces sp. ZAF1911 TaxID=2944129 RepID=UPI00237AB4D5|nr:HNH endonuclease family protein [Streptomyces sp. ZAF1911]MDD9383155.1 HNH endonuclease family protein [Streptomyces sp. ZAF1911]